MKGIPIQLVDGRKVDLCTESGANAFLKDGAKSKIYLAIMVEKAAMICATKRQLNEEDKTDLMATNLLFISISQYGTRDAFRQFVPRNTVEAWLKGYAIVRIKQLSTNRNWITTGELPDHDKLLLTSFLPMMLHGAPLELVFGSEFFNVLAELVKARKGSGRALPCADICHTITLIVASAHNTSIWYFDNKWTTEKVLKKLEATGVLEQFIRCATVPQHTEDGGYLFQMLNSFQGCVPFISKKMRPGKPCGDVVVSILQGRDGSMVERPSVLNKLKTIVRFADSFNPPEHQSVCDGYRICQNCGKSDFSESFQRSLMKCARCYQAYYCSRECQKADWKIHKKTCKPKTKQEFVMSECIQQTFIAFCEREYVNIMVKMVKTCEQTGLSKKDMLLELNFEANENGIVPAMQDQPEFKIAPVKDYIEGSRPAEPDWFRKNFEGEAYEFNIKSYLVSIEEKHKLLQPHQILCLVRYEGGIACTHVQMTNPNTNKQQFSEEALLAFKAYMNDDDDGPLSQIFEPISLMVLKAELGIHHGSWGLFGKEREYMDALQSYGEPYGIYIDQNDTILNQS